MSSSSSARGNPLNYSSHGSHLTPRTPRSKAGKPVTSFDDQIRQKDANDNGEEMDEVDMLYAQSYPLLRSSASATYPPEQLQQPRRSSSPPRHPKQYDPDSSIGKFKQFMDILPLALGAMGAVGLLAMILLSVHKPDVLKNYILKNTTQVAENKEQVVQNTGQWTGGIDYSNHSVFPLEGFEYEQECWNLQQSHGMSHGDYWMPMRGAEELDVPHEDAVGEGGVCSSTITYMLDANVGLFYDLALIAQTAALAREVSSSTHLKVPWLTTIA